MGTLPPPPDAACPYHHHFSLLTIQLTLCLYLQARLSFHGVQTVLAILALLMSGPHQHVGQPCFASVRQWLYRVGLFLLRRSLDNLADRWCVIIDHTMQLGQRKCCLVLGVPVAALTHTGYALAHHDVTVLALEVQTHSTGSHVAELLQRVQQRLGTIVQVVSDHGSDLCNGLRRLQQEQPELVATYDVRHLLAGLLKAELQHDPCWVQLLHGCGQLLPQVRQTAANFLAPPTLRVKARYMNVAEHVRWAQRLLRWAADEPWDELGQALGQTAVAAQAWFTRHLGWLLELRTAVADYAALVQIIAVAEEQVQEHGLNRHTAACFWQRWLTVADHASWRVWQFAMRVRLALAAEGEHIPSGETWLGSSLVIESLFGHYKALAARSPSGEMSLAVLSLPVLTATLTQELVEQALESTSWADVQAWQAEQLGASAASRKRQLLGPAPTPAACPSAVAEDHDVA